MRFNSRLVDKYLSIGDVSKMLGISIDMVRKLDEENKLPSDRTSGNQRRWNYADVWSYDVHGVINSRRPILFTYHTFKKPPEKFRMMGSRNEIIKQDEVTTCEYWLYRICSDSRAMELKKQALVDNWEKCLDITLIDPDVSLDINHKCGQTKTGIDYCIPFAYTNSAVATYKSDDNFYVSMSEIHGHESQSLHKTGCPNFIKFRYIDVNDDAIPNENLFKMCFLYYEAIVKS